VRIRTPGRIREGLWLLGTEEACVYLLEGDRESIVISGGMYYIVPEVLRQFKAFGIDESRIRRLLILHSHFDHVGIVPHFRHRYPGIQILASGRAWEILKSPRSVETINRFGRLVARWMKREENPPVDHLDWEAGISGKKVVEGDKIDLGGPSVLILETPGHSSCSISAYVPQWRLLFPSDAAGVPFEETIITPGNSNFSEFQQSMEKLLPLNVEFLCADHYGVVAGEEATEFIRKATRTAAATRAHMEEVYLKTGDMAETARLLSARFSEDHPRWLVSPEIVEGVFRQMVRHVAGQLTETGETAPSHKKET
jgi:glyoxylase-like metal-dependent hydrolase (beta-lactamase superfamily II)